MKKYNSTSTMPKNIGPQCKQILSEITKYIHPNHYPQRL